MQNPLWREKGWKRMLFYKTQDLILIRSDCKCFEALKLSNLPLTFINGEWWQEKEGNLENNITIYIYKDLLS